jgi:hypothetical protein
VCLSVVANKETVHGYKFYAVNTTGELMPHYILWDYYNGLVRVHDLFSCCKPGKASIPMKFDGKAKEQN